MLARSQFSPTLAHIRKVYVLVFFLSEDDPHHPWLSPYERRDHLITSSASAGDRRAAKQRDEVASMQLIEWHPIPHQQGSNTRISDWPGSVSGYPVQARRCRYLDDDMPPDTETDDHQVKVSWTAKVSSKHPGSRISDWLVVVERSASKSCLAISCETAKFCKCSVWQYGTRSTALPRAQEHPAYGSLHRAFTHPLPGLLERLTADHTVATTRGRSHSGDHAPCVSWRATCGGTLPIANRQRRGGTRTCSIGVGRV
jgi:hypothetical protein